MAFEQIELSYWHGTDDGFDRRTVVIRTSDASESARIKITEQMEMYGQRAGTVNRGENWYVCREVRGAV